MPDVYYVSKTTGDNGNAGTSAAAAWNTIQYAIDNATTAGDIVHVAPGIYRESLTIGAAGSAGLPITFEADPDIQHFASLGTILPGQVRVTTSDENDQCEGDTTTILTMGDHEYVTVRGFLFDGFASSDGSVNGNFIYGNTYNPTNGTGSASATGQILENCVIITGATYGVSGINTVRRCAVTAWKYGIRLCKNVYNCIITVPAAYGAAYANGKVIGCVSIGGGYESCNYVAHCSAFFANVGYTCSSGDHCYDSMAFGCGIGYYGNSYNVDFGGCGAYGCKQGYKYQGDNNEKSSPIFIGMCWDDEYSTSANYADLNYGSYPLLYMSNFLAIARALKFPFAPSLAGRAQEVGTVPDDADADDPAADWQTYSDPPGVDILGHSVFSGGDGDNRQRHNATGSFDIGPYAIHNVSSSIISDHISVQRFGVIIKGKGEQRYGLKVSASMDVTASVYAKSSAYGTGTPTLVLSGSPFVSSSLSATPVTDLIDRGSSWGSGWKQLTVKGRVTKTERLDLVLSGANLVTSSFSNFEVY